MKRAVRFFPIVGAALAVSVTVAAARDLGGFLGGFETACSGSKAFVRHMISLGEKYTSSGDLSRPVLVPDAFKDSIGQEKVADKGEVDGRLGSATGDLPRPSGLAAGFRA